MTSDIALAQQIISRKASNIKRACYHDSSIIYKTSNEKINQYKALLKDKEKMLSVIASGDQIINSLLEESYNIDGYDISRFPKYFLNLKLAAIESLSKNAFIKFFIEDVDTDEEYYDDMYELIRKNLSKKDREFWDGLFNFNDWFDIYNSTLFSSEAISRRSQIQNNSYLQKDNYDKVRENLGKRNLNYITGDISDIVKSSNSEYDLVNLSSIVYYGKYNSFKYYKEFLKSIPLQEEGKALTYLYNTRAIGIRDNFKGDEYNYLEFSDSSAGVMIYQKKK